MYKNMCSIESFGKRQPEFRKQSVYLKSNNNNVFLEPSCFQQFVKHLTLYDIIGYKNFGGDRKGYYRY